MHLKALILAGGLGTRLKEVIQDAPKPMAPVGKRPFLEYQIRLLHKFGIREIVLSVGYKADAISEYFKDGSQLSVSIEYSKEDSPLGTGGAIKKALSMLGDEFLVLNGDSIILEDLKKFIGFHKNKKAHQTLLLTQVSKSSNNRYGSIVVDKDCRIVRFMEKQETPTGLINAGIYLLRKDSIGWQEMKSSFSFEKELMPCLVQKNLYGFVSNGFFIDIGIPEDYFMIQNNVTRIIEYIQS